MSTECVHASSVSMFKTSAISLIGRVINCRYCRFESIESRCFPDRTVITRLS